MRHCFPGPCLRPCYMGCPLDTLLTPAYQKFFCLVLSDVLCFIGCISTVAMNISNSFHSYCQHDIINCHCKYDTEVCATLRGCYIMFCVRVKDLQVYLMSDHAGCCSVSSTILATLCMFLNYCFANQMHRLILVMQHVASIDVM